MKSYEMFIRNILFIILNLLNHRFDGSFVDYQLSKLFNISLQKQEMAQPFPFENYLLLLIHPHNTFVFIVITV